MPERTILDLYRFDVEVPREAHYTHYYPGGSRSFSTEEFFRRTAALAEGLASLGVTSSDRVMLLSENRPEWHMADLAVLDLGAVDVPVYPTLTSSQIAYQVQDSGSKVVVVENAAQAEKFLAVRDRCPTLTHLIQIEGEPVEGAVGLDEVISSADRETAGDRFWERAAVVNEDDLATIVYTSGTTGEPKGVMLSHRNFVANALHILPRVPTTRDDLCLEFLPLCHVFERCAGYFYMRTASSKAYCPTAAVGDLIALIAPTVFCSVPRVFEKVYDKVHTKVAVAPPVRRKLFNWAVGVGTSAARHRLEGTSMPAGLALRFHVADALVLKKVRAALGGRVRGVISGAAPLPLFANEFFHAIGVPVQEGYGLTETSPAITVNGRQPGANRLGSVGRVLDNLEVRIAEDGELLVRGPSVSSGYWNKPQETAESFDSDGFFHTGDIARIDEDGFVFITDRKKDLIVTAGGKNVAPQPIENQLKASRWVDNAVVVGDRKPYLVALLSPNLEELESHARRQGLEFSDHADLVARPEVEALFAEVVTGVNASLARYEQVKRFRVLPEQLTLESGHLTPTMKVKRRVVEDEYRDAIEELYREGAASE